MRELSLIQTDFVAGGIPVIDFDRVVPVAETENVIPVIDFNNVIPVIDF